MKLRKTVLAAMFLSLALILPFITAQNKSLNAILLPMHLPVFLCGIFCSWQYGLAVGLTAPLMRAVMFGMPRLYPDAVGMAFELATYGVTVALLCRMFRKRGEPVTSLRLILCMILAMIAGRFVLAAAKVVLYGAAGLPFLFDEFLWTEFVLALPGMLLQIIIAPALYGILKEQ